MDDSPEQRRWRSRRQLTGCFAFISLICAIVLFVGIAKFVEKKDQPAEKPSPLLLFMEKVKDEWFRVHPSVVVFNPKVHHEAMFELFQPYDPTPPAIKSLTDKALQLRKEFDNLKLDLSKLKPRERRGAAQIKYFLDSRFGHPYDDNYYAGYWMMGPNYFCSNKICSIGDDIENTYDYYLKPKSTKDLENIMATLITIESVFELYKANMMLGVTTGMVRAVEDCRASRNAFQTRFKKIALKGAKGVLKEKFTKILISSRYYDRVPSSILGQFEEKYGMNTTQKISDILITYVGTPIRKFMTFLESNYSRYCVPSNVSSGLANLPLKRVWLDQKETDTKTTRRLPTGELLSGRRTYKSILPYFLTSKSYTPKIINRLGETYLKRLYIDAIGLAMKITGKNQTETLKEFTRHLDDSKHFFNRSAIPSNENGEEGAKKCYDMASAKLHCPVRFEAMMSWFQFVEKILAIIETKIINLFYITGKYAVTPNCPIELKANFNPSDGSPRFQTAGPYCIRPSYYYIPFFMQRPGPRYHAFTVAGHEGCPGHSTQVQGFFEHFWLGDRGDVIDWFSIKTVNSGFSEGWASYAEYPLLAKDTDLYKGNALQEYGMLQMQLWTALCLIVDTGLHDRGMTLQKATDLFKQYSWDTTDNAYKSVIRYMSFPGQATSYMIGQLEIWKLRNRTESKLKENNKKFNLKDFHFQVLSQGSPPLEYLKDHIENYIECKINAEAYPNCMEILDPSLMNKAQRNLFGTKNRWNYITNNLPPSYHSE